MFNNKMGLRAHPQTPVVAHNRGTQTGHPICLWSYYSIRQRLKSTPLSYISQYPLYFFITLLLPALVARSWIVSRKDSVTVQATINANGVLHRHLKPDSIAHIQAGQVMGAILQLRLQN